MSKIGPFQIKIHLDIILYEGNKKRFRYILPKINLLKKELSKYYDVETFVISKQPKTIPQEITTTLLRKCALWKLNRDWITYKKQKPRNIFLDFLILLWRLLATYVNRHSENIRIVVDSFVTNKHIEAWSGLLGRKAHYLIVFEDDAVFTDVSLSTIKLFLHQIIKYGNRPVYLDFAGGCSPEVLKVSSLEYKSDKLRKYYRKPVTNTACCYLINNVTAELFLENIIRQPLLRLLPIDWLMNQLFILTADKNKFFCFHAHPHVIEHGTNTGAYKSWL